MKRKTHIIFGGLVILSMLVTTIPVGFADQGDDVDVDLICVDIWSTPQIDLDKFTVAVKIKNDGDQHAQSGFDVGFWTEVRPKSGGIGVLSRVKTKEVKVDLDAGKTRWIIVRNIPWSQEYPYEYEMRFWGEVDCFDEVIELHEDNNFIADDEWWD